MKTAYITYYGEGPLNLQMRRFKPGKSVKARLDDILPDERRRYQDRFLVTGPDGLIINIGSMVPDDVAKLVIGENPQVLRVTGFDVRIPPGFALDDTGAEPKIVEASVMAAKRTAVAVAVGDPPREAPNLTIVKDDPEPCGECGQVDVGQQGEYPCKACGLPTEHDKEYGEGQDGKEETLESSGEGDEKGQISPGKENAGEPEPGGTGEALGGGVAGSEGGSEGGEGARVAAADGGPGGEHSVVIATTDGPTLTDESPEEPKPVAKKKTRKPGKRSKADSLLEEF